MNDPRITRQKPPTTTGAFLKFLFLEICRQKKWALLPVWFLLVLIGVLLLASGSAHLLPAIYVIL